ncbi:MAG: universal stress protein [Litorimonas sp.]
MRQFSNPLFHVPDGDAADDPAIREGLDRAVSLTSPEGSVLTLVSVVETMVSAASAGRFHDELTEAFDALRAKRLARLEEIARAVPSHIQTVCDVLDGSPAIEVVKRVQLYAHDLVVAHGSDASGPMRRLFPSETMQLLRKCPCPVLILKPGQGARFERVFASIDFDYSDEEGSRAAKDALNAHIVDLAASIADHDGAKLDIVNVFTVPGEGAMIAGWIPMAPDNLSAYADGCRQDAQGRLDTALADSQARTKLGVFGTDRIKTHLPKGLARHEIPKEVAKVGADLVVMGTVGRVGVPGFLIGNTAETILGAIDSSVLALKPDGFVSPVTVE